MWRGAALLLLCLLTFVVGVGRTAIVDSDEAFYAGAGREMITGGDWITPHYDFEPRLNKPILFYWLVAGTYKVLGVTETAARLWAALSGVGLAFVAFLVGRRWIDDATGLLAGAIVATSLGLAMLVRQALPDMPLALYISITTWSAFEAMSVQTPVGARSRGGWSRRRWLLLSASALGLGLLTKGPIAIALPVVALAPVLLWERATRMRATPPVSFPVGARDLLVAAGVVTLIAAPWYILVTRANGLSFLRDFFVNENLDRFTTSKFNDRRYPGFYVAVMAGGLLPWTAFGLLWLRPVADVLMRRRPISPVAAKIGAWVLGPLLLLSVSAGSQPRYILPVVVPVALLLARSIWQRVPASDRLFTAAGVLAGLTMALLGALVYRAQPLMLGVNAGWTPAGAFVMMGSGSATIVTAIFASRRLVPIVVAIGAAATVIAFNGTVLQARRPEPVEFMATSIQRQGPAAIVCACGAFARNLTFYTHAQIVVGDDDEALKIVLQRADPVLAVTDARRLAAVESMMQRHFQRLAEVTYLNPDWGRTMLTDLWKNPGAALLAPDPDRYLQHLVLVSNQ